MKNEPIAEFSGHVAERRACVWRMNDVRLRLVSSKHQTAMLYGGLAALTGAVALLHMILSDLGWIQ